MKIKVTLNEVECLIDMYRIALFGKYAEKEDVDYIEKRIHYWGKIKKKLLED